MDQPTNPNANARSEAPEVPETQQADARRQAEGREQERPSSGMPRRDQLSETQRRAERARVLRLKNRDTARR